MTSPRILLDENPPSSLAAALRERGIDAVHVAEIGLKNVDDDVVFAAATRRCLRGSAGSRPNGRG